mgnify:CR=1 FL=1
MVGWICLTTLCHNGYYLSFKASAYNQWVLESALLILLGRNVTGQRCNQKQSLRSYFAVRFRMNSNLAYPANLLQCQIQFWMTPLRSCIPLESQWYLCGPYLREALDYSQHWTPAWCTAPVDERQWFRKNVVEAKFDFWACSENQSLKALFNLASKAIWRCLLPVYQSCKVTGLKKILT